MRIEVRRVEYKDVEQLREPYRRELNCQIVHDSFPARGLADPYLILNHGHVIGYGAVSNKYGKGRLMEFYTLPEARGNALPIFRELLAASQATHIEAQTNNPLLLLMLYDCARNIVAENILFHDASATQLACPNGLFRHAKARDRGVDADAEWVIEAGGSIVASGGFLCHYNPPYGDIYMSVAEGSRRRGYGSFLVQELKRVCYEAGKKPAARCNANNIASRRTLEKAGFVPCARILVGRVRPVPHTNSA